MSNSMPLALLVAAGLLSSTAPASAYIIYGNTVVNGTTYNLSPFANLINANLTGANLNGANLYTTDLSGSNLSGATLTGTNLINALLNNANLNNADLTGADLTVADLPYANLINANLTGANLTEAYLYGADLYGSNFSGVNLTYAVVSYSDWTDFATNSGAQGLGFYSYDTSLINFLGRVPAVPEPSTYGLIGIAALGVAFAASRRKLKKA